jgi:hypothetical protein
VYRIGHEPRAGLATVSAVASGPGALAGCRDAQAGDLTVQGTVEFPVSRSFQERKPFSWREPQHRAPGMLAVADADISADQVRHFDAVAVGEAQRTLNHRASGSGISARSAAGGVPICLTS